MLSGKNRAFFSLFSTSSSMGGANENTNGLIRQYILKGTDFSKLTDKMIEEIEWKLNNRPRKSLGYLTPLEYCKIMFNFDFGSRCTSN